MPELESIPSLIQVDSDNAPRAKELSFANEKRLLIEIPADIGALQRQSPKLAMMWREATRSAFTKMTSCGYIVEEFFHSKRNEREVGIYLLHHRKKVEDFS